MNRNLAIANDALNFDTYDIAYQVPKDAKSGLVKRDELARHLVTMYGHSAPNLAKAEIEAFDNLFNDLTDGISAQTRAFVAANLSTIPNAPHRISFRLANDTIDIARPVLIHSVVLTDSDLIVISEEHGSSHMMAIAQRPYLSTIVSDTLVFRGDDLVRQQIARNDGANISPRGFSRLAGQARTDTSMEQILVARPDLPGVAVHILVKFGSKTVRDQLSPGPVTKPLVNATSVAGRARELDNLDFVHARARVEQLSQQGQYGENLLMRFVAEEKLAESMVVLARILGVGLNDVKAWYLDTTPDTLLIAAKAYGIDTRAIFGVLGLGRWRLTLDARTRQTAIQRYQTMSKAHAVKLLSAWRKNRYQQTQ
jgi:uncharacterized protein (DUF2336 family)